MTVEILSSTEDYPGCAVFGMDDVTGNTLTVDRTYNKSLVCYRIP